MQLGSSISISFTTPCRSATVEDSFQIRSRRSWTLVVFVVLNGGAGDDAKHTK